MSALVVARRYQAVASGGQILAVLELERMTEERYQRVMHLHELDVFMPSGACFGDGPIDATMDEQVVAGHLTCGPAAPLPGGQQRRTHMRRGIWASVWRAALRRIAELTGLRPGSYDVAVNLRHHWYKKEAQARLSALVFPPRAARRTRRGGAAGADTPAPPCWLDIEHHEAHALSGFFDSPFNRAIVLSADGGGSDGHTNAFFAARDGGENGRFQLRRLHSWPMDYGTVYTTMASHLPAVQDPHAPQSRSLALAGRLMGYQPSALEPPPSASVPRACCCPPVSPSHPPARPPARRRAPTGHSLAPLRRVQHRRGSRAHAQVFRHGDASGQLAAGV